jgi:hypothetical protein
MPGSNCETWRWICDDLVSNILVFWWSHNYCGQITASDYMDIFGNQGHPVIQVLFPNNIFMKSGTVMNKRPFRTYVSLFQEGYKLYYRHMLAKLY